MTAAADARGQIPAPRRRSWRASGPRATYPPGLHLVCLRQRCRSGPRPAEAPRARPISPRWSTSCTAAGSTPRCWRPVEGRNPGRAPGERSGRSRGGSRRRTRPRCVRPPRSRPARSIRVHRGVGRRHRCASGRARATGVGPRWPSQPRRSYHRPGSRSACRPNGRRGGSGDLDPLPVVTATHAEYVRAAFIGEPRADRARGDHQDLGRLVDLGGGDRGVRAPMPPRRTRRRR